MPKPLKPIFGLSLCLLLCFLLSGPPADASNISRANDLGNQAVDAYRRNDFQRSLQLNKQALQIDPKIPQLWANLADTYVQLGQYQTAVENFNKAIEIYPNTASFYHRRGGAYRSLKQYSAAEQDFEKGTALEPKEGVGYCNLALLFGDQGRWQQVLDNCDKAISLNFTAPQCFYIRGRANFGLNKFDLAVKDFDKAISVDPKDALSFLFRGFAYSHLGQNAKALESYDKALQIDPNYGRALHGRALIYCQSGQYELAVADDTRALSCNLPDNDKVEAYANLGAADLKLGHSQKAIENCSKALELNPQRIGSLLRRGQSYAAIGQLQNAFADYDRYLQLCRDQWRKAAILAFRSLAKCDGGDYKGALEDAVNARQCLGSDSQQRCITLAALALAHAESNDPGSAEKAISECVSVWNGESSDLRRDDVQSLVRCAQAYLRMDKPQDCLTLLEKLGQVDVPPGEKSMLYAVKACAEQRTNQALLAESDAKEAIQFDPDSAFSRKMVASMKTLSGQSPAAVGHTISSNVQSSDPTKLLNSQVRDKWAVIIGVSKYKDADIPALHYAAKDARDFYDFLIAKEHFAPDHVRLLLNEQATKERILTELGDNFLPRVAKPDDLVVIYYSGHGSPSERDVSKKNFLVAYDTHKENLFASGIEMQMLFDMLNDRVASMPRTLVVLDACHSGAMDPNAKALTPNLIDVSKLQLGNGQLLISSSGPSERSWESKRYNNGIFTKRFIEALESKGLATNIDDAFAKLQDSVYSEALEDEAMSQKPHIMKEKWMGNPIILGVPPSSPSPLPDTVRRKLLPDSSVLSARH